MSSNQVQYDLDTQLHYVVKFLKLLGREVKEEFDCNVEDEYIIFLMKDLSSKLNKDLAPYKLASLIGCYDASDYLLKNDLTFVN